MVVFVAYILYASDPLPRSFYPANYSLVATGEDCEGPVISTEEKGRASHCNSAKQKNRKKEETNPLKRRGTAPLQN